ncbi:hypothetical protein ACFQ36_00460 [Arthrobacter sp. GCM10027362]
MSLMAIGLDANDLVGVIGSSRLRLPMEQRTSMTLLAEFHAVGYRGISSF